MDFRDSINATRRARLPDDLPSVLPTFEPRHKKPADIGYVAATWAVKLALGESQAMTD
jgi:hypothetical protein